VTRSSKPNMLVPRIRWRVRDFFFRVVNRVPNNPRPGRSAAGPYPPGGAVAAAETVKVEEDALDPGEIAGGLREQVRPAGAVHEREI
jgi:hypothetical protein